MSQSLRQCGRTTRMLSEAGRLAIEGEYVIVVCRDPKKVADRFHALVPCRRVGGEKVYVGRGSVSFVTDWNIDFERMESCGAHPSVQVLVDHHVIESKFARMLEMLHRYDPEPAGQIAEKAKLEQFTAGQLGEPFKPETTIIQDHDAGQVHIHRETEKDLVHGTFDGQTGQLVDGVVMVKEKLPLEVRCNLCHEWYPIERWTRGTEWCEDCNDDHDAAICPKGCAGHGYQNGLMTARRGGTVMPMEVDAVLRVIDSSKAG